MGLFSLEESFTAQDVKPEDTAGKTAAKIEQFESMHAAKVAVVEKNLERPPLPGEAIFVWTTAQFNTMSLIIWLIKNLGIIEELTISTYSISNICINTMFKWYDTGSIREIYFYLSDYTPRSAPQKWESLCSQASTRNIKIGIGFNHSKITLAKIGDNYIVIAGSGNFAENGGNEQYVICNNERIFNFYRECIREDHPVRYRQDRLD